MKVNGEIIGTELAVEIEGEGPPVVLLHGLGGTGNFYQPQVGALAERFTVIRPDLRGHGRSPATGEISIDGYVRDLVRVLDELELAEVRLVGHSMSTLTAQHFAAAHPGRVTALALLGAVHAPPEAGQQAQRQRAATVREKGMVAVADAVVANATSPATRRDQPAVAAFVRELLMRQDPAGYAAGCEALAGATEPATAEIRAPLLLATGADDGVGTPSVSEELATLAADTHTVVYDRCGHWTALEAAQRVTDDLIKFF
ncbi:MAG TPA: alpha/beta hydrolase [Pseudonocardia sp.]|jgi:pimeloyl-ACP methyl ester carboxylesterase|nr:alpha/beta hydrolase [Pseudonocardia sp.]